MTAVASTASIALTAPLESSSSLSPPPSPPPSPSYFGGYASQVDQTWSLINLGLGIYQRQRQSQGCGQPPQTVSMTEPGAGGAPKKEGGEKEKEEKEEEKPLLPPSFFSAPRGLLLYGPRGTGKSLLMREVAGALRQQKQCHVLRVSHDILLSK